MIYGHLVSGSHTCGIKISMILMILTNYEYFKIFWLVNVKKKKKLKSIYIFCFISNKIRPNEKP